MNNRMLHSILVLGALVAPVSLQAEKAPAPVVPVAYAVSSAGPYIERGSLRIWVLAKLGEPTERLSPDVWVYRGYVPSSGQRPVDAACNRLIVTFSDGAVANLQLANPAAADFIAANLRVQRRAAHVTASH